MKEKIIMVNVRSYIMLYPIIGTAQNALHCTSIRHFHSNAIPDSLYRLVFSHDTINLHHNAFVVALEIPYIVDTNMIAILIENIWLKLLTTRQIFGGVA